jgi:hypothetical protein
MLQLPPIDPTLLGNLLLTGLVTFIGSALGTALTHHYQQQRDTIAWGREKDKLQLQHQYELNKLRQESDQELYKQRELMVRTEILPTLLRLLIDANSKVHTVTATLRHWPDLNRLSPDMFAEWLAQSGLTDMHKRSLSGASDKLAIYQRIVHIDEINKAIAAFNNFHLYMIDNQIYINESLLTKLLAIDAIFSDLFITINIYQDSLNHHSKELTQGYTEFHQKSVQLISEITALVRTHGQTVDPPAIMDISPIPPTK